MKYESPITKHSKDMANVKVFADRQTDRRTGQKLYAPDLSIRGHKNTDKNSLLQKPRQNILKDHFLFQLPLHDLIRQCTSLASFKCMYLKHYFRN
jgi:hypothetical protein